MLHPASAFQQPLSGPWLAALPHPVLALDSDGVVIDANLPAAQLLGLDLEGLRGSPFAEIAVPEASRGGFGDVYWHAMAGRTWAGELPLITAPQARLQVAPVTADGGVLGAMVTIEAVPGDRSRSAVVSDRLNRLARVGAELQSASDMASLTNIVVSHLADAAGATTASLSVMLDEATLGLLAIRGGPSGASTRYASFPVDDTTPAGVAVLDGRPLLLSGRAAISSRFPDLEMVAEGERSMLCLPLTITDRPVGVATLSFPAIVQADHAELEFFQIMADSCAQALERIRAQESADQQHAKLTFIARASAELASSLDYESTLRNVAEMAVPDLADWCAISLAQDGILRTLAVAHRDPAKVQLALDFQQRYPPDPDADTGGYQVLRTGESILVPEVTDEMLVQGAQSEEHLAMLRELALYSGLTVPLAVEGRVLGTITWVNGETGRRFSADDIPFAEDLGRRAGIAIDNALLHSELREVAQRLQDAVRPPALPELPGWQLGATYTSAGRASVGGDFYDVIPLKDGRVAMAIGDVMGRGVTAAAAMSQIRAALRALVAVDPDPATVMSRLDLLYERFPSEQLVTLIYVLADPDLDQLVMSCAGHPFPVLVRADGSAEFLRTVGGTILGAGATDRQAVSVPFLPGDMVMMYTDGLLERRGEDPQESEARLLESYRSLRPEPTAEDLARLAELMRDPSRDDDVAVLAARRLRDGS
ncbi:MAG TPA: SpoIIE family protein phosphatase [Marmoricola sp.]|nr:SpoIIE family protein phosphatase [Marmoricola sp.]